MKREAYERQNGIYVKCKKPFDLDEMEADHVKPWSRGGKTDAANCQLLCLEDKTVAKAQFSRTERRSPRQAFARVLARAR